MNDRPTATLPIHHLMDQLEDLRQLLNQSGEKMKVLEAYDHFIRESDRGRMCTYSLKCKGLFELKLLPEVKERVRELVRLVEILDGGSEDLADSI